MRCGTRLIELCAMRNQRSAVCDAQLTVGGVDAGQGRGRTGAKTRAGDGCHALARFLTMLDYVGGGGGERRERALMHSGRGSGAAIGKSPMHDQERQRLPLKRWDASQMTMLPHPNETMTVTPRPTIFEKAGTCIPGCLWKLRIYFDGQQFGPLASGLVLSQHRLANAFVRWSPLLRPQERGCCSIGRGRRSQPALPMDVDEPRFIYRLQTPAGNLCEWAGPRVGPCSSREKRTA